MSAGPPPSRGPVHFQASRLLLPLCFLRSLAEHPIALGRPSSLEGPHWPSKDPAQNSNPEAKVTLGENSHPDLSETLFRCLGRARAEATQRWSSEGERAAQESFLEEEVAGRD